MCNFTEPRLDRENLRRTSRNLHVPVLPGGLLARRVNPGRRGFAFTSGLLLSTCLGLLLLGTAQPAWSQVTFGGVVSAVSTGGTITLSAPGAVAVDSFSNVYIADSSNQRIVMVNPAGSASVLTINGLSPALGSPAGLAINSAGMLYIADPANNRIVQVSTSGGTAAALGTGGITLSGPSGVAADISGNIFIADTGHARIVEVPFSGAPSVLNITGLTGPATLSNPSGMAVDRLGNLYIADTGNNRIVLVTPEGAGSALSITGLAPALSGPRGVAVDALDNVYIADTGNNRIAMVTSEGVGSKLSTAAVNLNAPDGVGVDVFGTVYIADTGASQILTVATSAVGFGHTSLGTVSGITQTLPFTVSASSTLGAVDALTLGAQNLDFTVASGSTCTSGTTDTTCTVNVQFLPKGPGLRRGALVLYNNAGPASPLLTIPLYGFADAPVAALAPNTASVINTGSVSTILPLSIALDGSGNLYVGNSSGSNLVEVPAGGGSGSVVNTPGETLGSVYGLALDGAGNLFIADTGNNRIVVVTPGGVASVLSISSLSTGINSPYGLAFDAAGNLYIADSANTRIVKVSSLVVSGLTSSGAGSVVSTGSFNLGNVTGVAVGPAGTLFIADPSNHRVLSVTAAGAVSVLIPPGITPPLSSPQGVGFDAMGNLYIADSGNNRIVEITTTGVASVVSTPGLTSPATLGGPFGVAVDPSGNVFIPDEDNNRIVEVPVSGATLAFPGTRSGFASPPETATVTNLGNQPLVFAANPAYTADFSANTGDTNPCTSATSLSRGTACDVSVIFTPQSVGNLSAGITLTDNALNMALNTQQVSASGMGLYIGDTTATAVSVAPSSLTIGQTVTLTATVSDTTAGDTGQVPTGQVTFTDTVGSTITSLNNGLGVSMSGGKAILTGVLLQGVGSHTITAVYGGVSNQYLTSTGTAPATVSQATATLALHPTTAVTYGTAGSVSATVTGSYATIAAPSGSVNYTILNASSTVVASGAVPLTVGSTSSAATIPVPNTLAPGSYTVSATYGGDNNYLPISTPTTFALTVQVASPTVSLASSLNPVLITNSVTFTATVTSAIGSPSGTVSFLDGQTLLTKVPLTQGVATYTTSSLALGTHVITVDYSGDSNFASVTSNAVSQLVIDFIVTTVIPTGQATTATALPGSSASFTIQAAPTLGENFPSAVTFALSGLPAGATAAFSPSTLAAGSPGTNVTLVIQLANQIFSQNSVKPLGGGLALAMVGGMFLLPFGSKPRRGRKKAGKFACLLLLLVAVACATLGLTGCGGGSKNGYFGQQQRTYTMTVTATSGVLSHTTTVSLTVE